MRHFNLFILLFVANFIFAQGNFDLNWGPDSPDKFRVLKILGQDDKSVFSFVAKDRIFYLDVSDKNTLKINKSYPIELPKVGRYEYSVNDIRLTDKGIIVFGNYFDKKADIYHLDAFFLSKEGKLNPKSTEIFATPIEKSKGKFMYAFNEDLSLVTHLIKDNKNGKFTFEGKVIDHDAKLIGSFNETVEIDDDDDLTTITNSILNKKGDVYVSVTRMDRKRKERTELFEMYVYRRSEGYKKHIHSVELINKHISEAFIKETNDNHLILTGYYTEVKNNGKPEKFLQGMFFAKVDLATKEIEVKKFTDFGKKVLIEVLTERKVAKGKQLRDRYEIRYIKENKDGGVTIVSEEHLLDERVKDGKLNVTNYYDDILVINVDDKGEIIWARGVPKRQIAFEKHPVLISVPGYTFAPSYHLSEWNASMEFEKEFFSFFMMPQKDDGIVIAYNDHIKNQSIEDSDDYKNLTNVKQSVPVIVSIDKDGNLKRIDVDQTKKEVRVRPKVFHQVSETEYLIYGSYDDLDKIGRIKLKD